MTDARKRTLVAVAGVAIVGAGILLGGGGALRGLLGERAERGRRLGAECEAAVERTPESPTPLPGYRSSVVYRRTTPPPSAIRLATLRLPGRFAEHQKVIQSDDLQYQCLHDATVELGGNDFVLEGIEQDAKRPEYGKLVEAVYLVAAAAPPPPFAARFPHRVTVVTDVFPDTPAHRAGLEPGDLAVDLDHRGLGEGEGELTQVAAAIVALPDAVPATLTVVRGGEMVELPVRKENGLFGFRHQTAPILPGRAGGVSSPP
jgi:hypothetical protein